MTPAWPSWGELEVLACSGAKLGRSHEDAATRVKVMTEAAMAEPTAAAAGKLAMRKRRAASVTARSMRSKTAARAVEARGIGLDISYRWANPGS